MKQRLFIPVITLALYVSTGSVSQAARAVTPLERGVVYWPPAQCGSNYACTDWSGVGAYINQFSAQDLWNRVLPETIKLPHGRLQHFAQLDDWTEALFPYSQLVEYDNREVAAGRPSLFVSATYAGKRRPVLWNWFGVTAYPYGAYPARPVNLNDERFAQFYVNQYIRPWLAKINKPNTYILLDNGTFIYNAYGVNDDFGNFIRPVVWDYPYPQNQAEFLTSINNFIVRIKQIDPTIKLVQATDAASSQSEFMTVSQNLDGIFIENMEYYYQTPSNDWLRSQFYNQILNAIWIANAGKIGKIAFAHTSLDPVDIRRRYMHYLMVRGDNFFFAPSTYSGELPPSYYSAMKNALGVPTAPTVMAQESGRPRGYVLYSRQTTGGIAYLNWTGVSKTITLPAGRTYVNSAGQPVTQITIPDYSGDYVLFSGSTASNAAPNVSLTAPVNGATYTAPATITLTASASDSDGSISRVEFWQGSNKLGERYAAPYTWTISGAPAGVYSGAYALTARAFDNVGAMTTSNAVSVTVTAFGSGNQPPIVSLVAPGNGATYTAPATITMTASASDPDGSIARVEFWQGPNKLGERYAAPYTWTINGAPAGVYTGAYALTARAVDNQGTVATSNAVSVTVTSTSNQPPVVSLSAPVNGATYNAPATITMTATAYDPDGSIARVEFWQGANKLGERYAAPYTWTIYGAPAGVYSGAYALTARAVDNRGAVTASSPIAVTVR